jgi:hypothetical protein
LALPTGAGLFGVVPVSADVAGVLTITSGETTHRTAGRPDHRPGAGAAFLAFLATLAPVWPVGLLGLVVGARGAGRGDGTAASGGPVTITKNRIRAAG